MQSSSATPRPLHSSAIAAVVAAVVATVATACREKPPGPAPAASAIGSTSAPSAPSASAPATPAPSATPSASTGADPGRYAWLADPSRTGVPAAATLASAIPTPPGWERIAVPPQSFSAWLRDLPLAAPGTPVKNWRGDEVYPGNEEYVQAVVAIDVGKGDLQQSSDVILRLHAEWQWWQGKRDMTYLAATKDSMSYADYCSGKRPLAQGPHIYWVKQRDPNDPNDRGAFRDFLDVVFMWANSTAVRMQSEVVAPADLAPGDFFLQRDKSGHAVVILDVVAKPSGDRLALLGQALTPAMNIHVLRPGRGTAWFSLRPTEPLLTPHNKEFAWSDLRRLRTSAGDAKADAP
ncbi:MAG: hypothetical protein JW751_10740 [Polyangiaceae bacterium]|nr:hypothetical protein [Polyangiaceae bacterium]